MRWDALYFWLSRLGEVPQTHAGAISSLFMLCVAVPAVGLIWYIVYRHFH